ncbi:MAG: hypothetical protein CVU05_15035, partial [Bacteroidetes bacterium HGW-Bacteroidetes-21]
MKPFLLFFLILVVFASCKKDKFTEDAGSGLVFSDDTLMFDTVFTTIGSATRYFKIYNNNSQDLKIKRIYLAGNNGFRLNINGSSTNSLQDVIIKENDSLFIFVEVNVNPLSSNSPLTILDSVMFETNDKTDKVILMACGQDVHLIDGEIISDDVWVNDKPYLIYNSMLVDSNATLIITSGVRLYFHNESRLYVAGTLIVNGSLEEPVIFQGDRLEQWYKDIPGQWDGLYFLPGSKDNSLTYCEVKNAIIGIQADTMASVLQPTVTMLNSKILNMNAVGIYGRGTSIHAVNCVISNAGQYAVAVVYGGSYEFYHCTIYNDWSYSNRVTPSVVLNNYYQDAYGVYQVRPLEKATFGNCIIYGSKEDEIVLDEYSGSPIFNYWFDHCLMKTNTALNTNDANHFIGNFKNISPGFISASTGDFELDTLSNSKDKGNFTIGNSFPMDFLNHS